MCVLSVGAGLLLCAAFNTGTVVVWGVMSCLLVLPSSQAQSRVCLVVHSLSVFDWPF